MAREGKAGASLAGKDIADAKGTADFGCLVGGKVMTANKQPAPDYLYILQHFIGI